MSRGKNNANLVPNGGSALQQNGLQSAQSAARRGNKTLAWYISDKILDKQEQEGRDSSSPLANLRQPLQPQSVNHNRKNSVDSQSSHNSSIKNQALEPVNPIEEEKKRSKKDKKQAKQRANSKRNVTDFYMATSAKENEVEEPERQSNNFGNKERKEDYWYFDPVSDGFYYEFNGSRGWRKRNPKLHGPNGANLVPAKPPLETQPQEKAIISQVVQQQPLQQSTTTAGSQPPQSKFFPSANVNVPNIKYYDAASDGFFYEMASVDGWRRRQPIGSNGISPPNSLASQPPAQAPTQVNRIFRPLQQPIGHRPAMQMVQQPKKTLPQKAQNLTNAELEDMILHSRSVPMSIRQPMFSLQNGHEGTSPLSFASASNFQSNPSKALNGSRLMKALNEDGNQSSSSTTMSSSLSDDHCSPPPAQQKHQQPFSLMNLQNRPWLQQPQKSNRPQPNAKSGVDTQPNQTKVPIIGSFEEPYEFYWSDNDKQSSTMEKAPSVSSTTTDESTSIAQNSQHQRHPSLAAYFNGMSMQEQYDNQLQQQLAQHAEHLKPFGNKTGEGMQRSNSMQLKRPSSLRLQTQASNYHFGQTQAKDSYMPHCFNVDQFIADLPPVVDQEHMLHNLSALRTPMVESQQQRLNSFDYQDSPLFTPIVKDTWSLSKLVMPSTCSSNPPVGPNHPTNGVANGAGGIVSNMERDLKEIEKIWKCPAF